MLTLNIFDNQAVLLAVLDVKTEGPTQRSHIRFSAEGDVIEKGEINYAELVNKSGAILACTKIYRRTHWTDSYCGITFNRLNSGLTDSIKIHQCTLRLDQEPLLCS